MVASASWELPQGQCQHITCMRPRTRPVWSLCVRLLWLQGGLSTPPPHHRTEDRWASIPRPGDTAQRRLLRDPPGPLGQGRAPGSFEGFAVSAIELWACAPPGVPSTGTHPAVPQPPVHSGTQTFVA